jgi:hypothetical protein
VRLRPIMTDSTPISVAADENGNRAPFTTNCLATVRGEHVTRLPLRSVWKNLPYTSESSSAFAAAEESRKS